MTRSKITTLIFGGMILFALSHGASASVLRHGVEAHLHRHSRVVSHHDHHRTPHVRAHRGIYRAPNVGDLLPVLADKVREILSGCPRSKLISGYRPGAIIAGTHRASLHSYYPSRAADVSGSAACIYAHLHGWAGGYSIDYQRVHHVHISFDPAGRERGSRFVHGGTHRYAIKHKIHEENHVGYPA